MTDQITYALATFDRYNGWIIWNLWLAFIPLGLSFWLFRRAQIRRSLLWWAVFVAFFAFLPNAPYLLTDIIHLIRATRAGYSMWTIALFFIPLHLGAILCGFEAYVLAVMNQSRYLAKIGRRSLILPAELFTHMLCAVGVYLGRFNRFNSWDLIVDPNTVIWHTLNNLSSQWPVAVIALTFIILAIGYWLAKQITVGMHLRWRQLRAGLDWTDESYLGPNSRPYKAEG